MTATLYLTLDVEPDYARTTRYDLLDRTGPFFDWLRAERIPLTAFVTGHLLERGHALLDTLAAAGVSVGVHGHSHAPDRFGTMHSAHTGEIATGTAAFRRRFGATPAGYRAPSGILSAADVRTLQELGYRYDSSVFPLRRPGRFDFTRLPRAPFRWQGGSLIEWPMGLLTARLPAGLTFLNLFGPRLGTALGARALRRAPASGWVLDGHFHNLFARPDALRELPLALRAVYRLGMWHDGLDTLRQMAERWRQAGARFAELQADALRLDPAALPEVDPAAAIPPREGDRGIP